jgi:hypothetical protein
VSLINDALRKARLAAAEHEAQQPDATFRAPKAYPSRGPRRRSGVVMLAVVAVMAGLAGAAVAWWAVGQREQPVATVAPTPTASPTTVIEQPNDPRPEPTSTAVVHVQMGEETAVILVPTPTPAALQVATALEQTPEPTPAPTQQKQIDRVFVLDADLGYATLSLGYIVARPVNPFAEINGAEVFIGSEVEGFRVEKIEADRVVLQDEKGELVLRVP